VDFGHQRRGALMPIDRKKLIEGRLWAKALLAHPDQEIRNLAKKALDHAEVALGMTRPGCEQRTNRPRRTIEFGRLGAPLFATGLTTEHATTRPDYLIQQDTKHRASAAKRAAAGNRSTQRDDAGWPFAD
jgi:hypothetical protein